MMSDHSMIGCRVSALFGDGYYAPAIIQRQIDNGMYMVKFDDDELMKCSGENMIGDKFKNISQIKLQRFQKVYTTHRGLTLCGYVQECNNNMVVISIVDPTTRQKEIISRKIEDISLLDERTDNGNCHKTRPVSASIKVPKPSHICRTSEEPTMTELMAAMVLSNLSCSPVFHNPATQNKGSDPHSFDSSGVGSWNPDTHHLSPPRSSVIQHAPREYEPTSMQTPPPQRLLSPDTQSEYDSNMILIDRSPLAYNHDVDVMNVDEKPQDLRVPKPNLKETSPKHIPTDPNQAPILLNAPHQLDVVMEQEEIKKEIPILHLPFPSNIRLPYFIPTGLVQQPIYGSSLPADFRIQLASTPPHHSPDVEPAAASSLGHIDNKMHRHLHRTIPYHKSGDDSTSDVTGSPSSNKQGNYFPFSRTPIPVGSLSFSPSHHTKPTRSPFITSKSQHPQPCTSATPPIPILQSNSISETTTYPLLADRNFPLGVPPSGQPINIPGTKAFSWHSSGMPMYTNQKPSIVQQRQHLHHGASPKMTFPVSPKSLPLGRKVRGDGKKCRKVYGMENRDLWCTACRWKKACQRFPD